MITVYFVNGSFKWGVEAEGSLYRTTLYRAHKKKGSSRLCIRYVKLYVRSHLCKLPFVVALGSSSMGFNLHRVEA